MCLQLLDFCYLPCLTIFEVNNSYDFCFYHVVVVLLSNVGGGCGGAYLLFHFLLCVQMTLFDSSLFLIYFLLCFGQRVQDSISLYSQQWRVEGLYNESLSNSLGE